MKVTEKQKKALAIVVASILILWGSYQLGYLTFNKQKDYDPDDDEGGGGGNEPNLSPTFNAENIAQSFYFNLDGGTDYYIFMDTCDMILALSNDELVAVWNEYTSLYADTDFPTMRLNIMSETLGNWIYTYPLSGWGKINEGENARDQVCLRFDLLNLP